jgi:hypothetical protein
VLKDTLEIVSPKLYTAKLICILKIVLRAMSVSTGTIQDVLDYVLRRKKPTGEAENNDKIYLKIY